MFHNLQRLTIVHEAGFDGHPDLYHFQHKREHGKVAVPRDPNGRGATGDNSDSEA